MPITINIAGDNATEALRELRTLAGGLTQRPTIDKTYSEVVVSDVVVKEPDPAPEQTEAPAHREFGKAPEGKSRRTKEEIAEDDELAALAEKAGVSIEDVEAAVRERGHASVIAHLKDDVEQGTTPAANISANPEDRQDPENPEDAAQDAADEQAEVDAGRDAENPLTLDDLREAMNALVEKKGMPEVQKAGPGIFEKALGKPPAGETAWKLSLLSDATQDQLSAAIAAWKEAANG